MIDIAHHCIYVHTVYASDQRQDFLFLEESASYESCMKNALQPGVTPHLAEDKHKQMYVIKKKLMMRVYQRSILT